MKYLFVFSLFICSYATSLTAQACDFDVVLYDVENGASGDRWLAGASVCVGEEFSFWANPNDFSLGANETPTYTWFFERSIPDAGGGTTTVRDTIDTTEEFYTLTEVEELGLNVKLTVTVRDDMGAFVCEKTSQSTGVNVYDNVVPDFSAVVPAVLCQDDTDFDFPVSIDPDGSGPRPVITGSWGMTLPGMTNGQWDSGPYSLVWTPDAGQCAEAAFIELTVSGDVAVLGFDTLSSTLCASAMSYTLSTAQQEGQTLLPGEWEASGGTLMLTGDVVDDGDEFTFSPAAFDDAGAAEITLTFTPAASVACGVQSTHVFTLTSAPSAGEPTDGTNEYCVNDDMDINLDVLLEDIGANGAWFLEVNGSLEASAATFPPSDLGPGTYNFSYIVGGGGCSPDTAVVQVTVRALPEFADAPVAISTTSCTTDDGQINGQVTGAEGISLRVGYERIGAAGISFVDADNNGNFLMTGLAAAEYQLYVEYADGLGCQEAALNTIIVGQPDEPQPEIDLGATALCLDGTISIEASGGNFDDYTWDIAGGNASMGTNGADLGEVDWASPGDKTITLTVVEDGCTSQEVTETVRVQALPFVEINLPDGSIYDCTARDAGGLLLEGNASADVTFDWSGPGTNGGAGNGIDFTATQQGSYQLTVTSDDALQCSITSDAVAITEDLVDPTVVVSTPGNVTEITCTQESIEISVTASSSGSNNSFTYLWNDGNGSTSESINVMEEGDFQVVVTNGRNGCSATSDIIMIEEDREFPVINSLDNLTSAGGLLLNCSNPSTTVVPQLSGVDAPTTLWTFPGGNSMSPTLFVDENRPAGGYVVRITNPDNDCFTESGFSLSKNFKDPAFSIEDESGEDDFAACAGTELVLEANLTNESPEDDPVYSWTGGGSPGTGETYSIASNGSDMNSTRTVSLTVTYDNGCNTEMNQTVTIYDNPDVNSLTFAANTPNESGVPNVMNALCLGGSGVISAMASGGNGAYGYSWFREGVGVSGAGDSYVVSDETVTSGTNYRVTVTDDNGCIASEAIPIQVFRLPSISITSLENTGVMDNDFTICLNDPITLRAMASGTLEEYIYSWRGPSSSTDLPGFEIGFVGSTPGILEYTSNVTDGRGCKTSMIQEVEVKELPGFNVGVVDDSDNNFICTEEQFSLVATPANSGLTYTWNGSLVSPTFNEFNGVNNPATTVAQEEYTVVAVDEFQCSADETITVDIYPGPFLELITSNVTPQVNTGGTMRAELDFAQNLFYEWQVYRTSDNLQIDLMDNTTQAITVIFPEEGNWEAELIATTQEAGCAEEYFADFTVVPPNQCSPNFQITGISTGQDLCPGQVYSIQNTSSNGTGNSQIPNVFTYEFSSDQSGNNPVNVEINGNSMSSITLEGAGNGSGNGVGDITQIIFPEGDVWISMDIAYQGNADGEPCSSSKAPERFTVRPQPEISSWQVSTAQICEGETFLINASANSSYEYDFRFGIQTDFGVIPNNISVTGGSGSSSALTLPPGNYSIIPLSLEYTDLDDGCNIDSDIGVSPLSITVRSRPVQSSAPVVFCNTDDSEATIRFAYTTFDGSSYRVIYNDQTSGAISSGGQYERTFSGIDVINESEFNFTIIDESDCETPLTVLVNCGCNDNRNIGDWADLVTCQNSSIPVVVPGNYVSNSAGDVLFWELKEGSIIINSGVLGSNNLIDWNGLDYNAAATYRVEFTSGPPDGNGGIIMDAPCNQSTEVNLIVRAVPMIEFLDTDETICENDSTFSQQVSVSGLVNNAELVLASSFLEQGNSTPITPNSTVVTANGSNPLDSDRDFTVSRRVYLREATISYPDGEVCTTMRGDGFMSEDTLRVTVNALPQIDSVNYLCNDETGEDFQVELSVTTQNNNPFSVGGLPGSINQDKFTSEVVSIDTNVEVDITDNATSCKITSEISGTNCSECQNGIGVRDWNDGRLEFCEASPISITSPPSDSFRADGNDRILYTLVQIEPDGTETSLDSIYQQPLSPPITGDFVPVSFDPLLEYPEYDPTATFRIDVELGNGVDPNQSIIDARCLQTSTIALTISSAPEPRIEIFDPSTNMYTEIEELDVCRNTPYLDFRVVNGSAASEYDWNVSGISGDPEFIQVDNPFEDPSHLSIRTANIVGLDTISVVQKLVSDPLCFGSDEFVFRVTNQQSDRDREIFLIENGNADVLVVEGDEGNNGSCTYQWGRVDRDEYDDEGDNTLIEGQTNQSLSIFPNGIDPGDIYWVDVTCGDFCTTRYYYDRDWDIINRADTMRASQPVSIAQVGERIGQLTIAPNPNNGQFSILLDDFRPGNYDLRLIDGLGRTIRNERRTIGQQSRQRIEWDVFPKPPAGMYYIRIADAAGNSLVTPIAIHR